MGNRVDTANGALRLGFDRSSGALVQLMDICLCTWKAEDGDIGIAIASISDRELQVELDFPVADYGLPDAGNIRLHTAGNSEALGGYSGGRIELSLSIPPRSVLMLELSPG